MGFVHVENWSRHKCSQVFVESVLFLFKSSNTSINLGHGFKKANALILRCR